MAGIQIMPGFFDEIKPGLEQIGRLVGNIRNPNAKQEIELRRQLAQDPNFAQKLIDMGPDAVTKIYGKNAQKYYDPKKPVSSNKKLEDIMAGILDNTTLSDEQRDEIRSKVLGTRDSITREGAKAQNRIGAQTEAANTLTLEQKAAENQREIRARMFNAKLPPGTSIYQLSREGKITPEQLGELRTVKEFDKKYDEDRDDFWRKANLEHQTRVENRLGADNDPDMWMQKMVMQRKLIVAGEIAEKFGGDVENIISVQKDPILYKKLLAEPEPTDPASLPAWRAAQALNRHSEDKGITDIRTARATFQRETASDFNILRAKKGVTPDLRLQALNNINKSAMDNFMRFTDDIPQWTTDQDAPGAERGGGRPDLKTTYRVGGDPTIFGSFDTGLGKAPEKTVAGEKVKPNSESTVVESWKALSPAARKIELDKITDQTKKNRTKALLSKNGITIQ